MDEPVTPGGRLFLRPENDQVINCAIGFENPIDVDAIKVEISNSMMIHHPKFCSLLVKNSKGREYWRETEINLDDHIIIHNFDSDYTDESYDTEEKINSMLADFAVSCPLSLEKPLWEIHIVNGLKFFILRLHHALGDGISLMSLFLASCKKLRDAEDYRGADVKKNNNGGNNEGGRRVNWISRVLMMIWYTSISVVVIIGRTLWVGDKKTVISGGDGVELWPRLVATAKFSLEDMKTVKRAIHNVSVNDVLLGVISSGLSKYVSVRSPHVLQEELRITGVSLVNLRKQPGLLEMEKLMKNKSGTRWGNRIGIMLLPIYCHSKNDDVLGYVKRSKVMIDQKKQSLESYFSYAMVNSTISLFGPKDCLYTTFTVSNLVGPSEELTYAANPITFIRATSSSLAHALTMHMVNYAGMANMQILVAKDIIPDPQFLANCFEDALLEMKIMAESTAGEDIS